MARYQRNRRPLVSDHTAWEQDQYARAFVVEHPSGGTLEQVAAVMDLTRERVRQIEAVALRKLHNHCRSRGLRLRDVLGREVEESVAEVLHSTG